VKHNSEPSTINNQLALNSEALISIYYNKIKIFRNKMETRLNVLKVYKKIIKLSNGWKFGNDTLSNQIERNYIKNEARTLFKSNKNV
jgi:hypothetical protein